MCVRATLIACESQGVRGGEDRLHDLNLVKGGHVYGGGTVTEPRALPLMPAPSSVSGVRPAVKALGAAGLHVEMAETLGELKERTKEAMERTNFSLAASLSRLALAKGEDPALLYVLPTYKP